jgi:hypothetical protein
MLVTMVEANQASAFREHCMEAFKQRIDGTTREYYRGKYHCTIDLLLDWFGISCMTTDNLCFYLQNRLIQTSQTGGQWYSDTSPFSIPCCN